MSDLIQRKRVQFSGLPVCLALVFLCTACDGETLSEADVGVPADAGQAGIAGDSALAMEMEDSRVGMVMDQGRPDAQTSPIRPECDDGPLNQWEQKMLDAHNHWRSAVDPPAANMYRVYWDTHIARNAAAWVAQCDPTWPHSSEEARSQIGGYDVLGENLSFCAGTGCADDPSITDGSGMGDGEGWWAERLDYDWTDDTSRGVTAHYTQMVSSNVYAIGCATQRCPAPGPSNWDGEWWWTICQYGPRGQAYWVGNKPYEAGEGGLIEPPADAFEEHCLMR